MSAEPSRARIDQFFASRKRKNLLPKDEISDKESRSPAVGSPSGKSTLDGFLSKSPKGTPLACVCEDDDSSPRHELVKRNLGSEIGSGSDASRKLAFNSCAGNGCAKENRPGDHLDSAQCPSIAVVAEREKDSSEAVLSRETPSEGNLELKKFAADFLSLYCSDVQAAVSLPSEPEQKGQKRNGSPSYLTPCSKVLTKRQCPLEASHNFPEPPTCRSQAIAENEEVKEVKFNISGGKKLNSEINVGVSLRRCSATPSASNTNVRHCREGRSCNTEGPSGTPKSAVRNSMFSPGEEFWCEAIQVADCLLPAVTKPNNLPCSSNEISDNKLVADGSSFMVPQNKNVLNGTGEMTSKDCSKTFEKIVPENIMALRVNQTNSASPLPVKHFDFSHEDSLQQCVAEKTEVSVIFSIQAANDNGVNHEFLHHSPQPEQEKDISSVPNGSSYANENSCQTGADFNLAVSKGQCVSLTQDNSSPSGNAHDSANREEKNQKVSVSDDSHEVSGTPSSFMLPEYRLQLHSWLPSEVCSIYMKKGISKLYPWQVECLLIDGVLERRNLVYCATTSAGKSFVAEILMLRQVLSSGKMALLVLPYVSLCAEKAEHLELLLEPFGKHVRSFYGNQGGGALPKDTSVAVCTIEKANSLINRLLEESRLSELGIIVIDELHMVADQHHGYLLELLLTKLRYAAGEGSTDLSSGERSGGSSGEGGSAHGLQIVGMSATMPNVAAVADWLQKPESSINSDERDYTKRLVYGILYGMGPNALGEQLQCSPEEATEKIQSFKYSFPGISTWLDEAVSSCRQKGYIKTLMGRKRFLSKIKFGNNKEKAKAQRQAVNSICQGSAADIVKVAMLNVHSAIVDGRSNFNGITAEYPNLKGHCRIILQVHDELVLEVEPSLIKAAGNFLQSCMENAVSLLVPLRVKLKFGKTWGSLEPLQLEP
ncbi:helicase and polymerase-containing protein TEBICHI [Curcuma longa]|uniref:helicase and polymerase-containing protein TEBICHI n=1 Tax=Curcuma longa TaxID=136217 RepID=UPI003D9F1597